MTSIREVDELRARDFFDRPDAVALVERYQSEMGKEVLEDWVKTGMYCLYREYGMDSFYAELNACRRAPGAANTDRHFSEKARHRMNTMSPANREKILKMAHKAGISTQGKVYVGGLGRYTDKHAWVSSAEDLLTVAKQRNLNVRGAVKHDAVSMADKPRTIGGKLAPDIMQRHVNRILTSEPATAERVRKNPKKLREVKERILAKHAPPKREA